MKEHTNCQILNLRGIAASVFKRISKSEPNTRKASLPALILTGVLLTQTGFGQTSPYAVQGIYTDFNSYWTSTTTFVSPVQPNHNHNLLAFTHNGVTYSTGVNDATLTANAVTFQPNEYKAMPLTGFGTPTSNTKIAGGSMLDGDVNNAIGSFYTSNMGHYLTDGPNGLNLGTGVANIPTSSIIVSLSDYNIQSSNVGDGIPDVLITQIADPATTIGALDRFAFYDENGVRVGNEITISYNNIPKVGDWRADFLACQTNPATSPPNISGQGSFVNGTRALRLWVADYSSFGITNLNVQDISELRISLNGSSDMAFVAFNQSGLDNSSNSQPLPVSLVNFSGNLAGNEVLLSWETALEENNEKFEIQASQDGVSFTTIGIVKGAGNYNGLKEYAFRDHSRKAGFTYYRLKQVDFDGKYTFSKVITVGNERTKEISLYPNPTNNGFTISHDFTLTQQMVEVTDLTGRVMVRKTLDKGATSTFVETSTLRPGIYQVVIFDGENKSITKLVKQ